MTGGRIRKDLGRILSESGGTRRLSVGAALAGCLSVGASLLFVWGTKRIVDFAVAPGHHIPLGFVWLLVGSLLLQLLLPAARRRIEAVALTRYSNSLRRRLLLHLLQSQWTGRGGGLHNGDAINRMRDDVATLASLTCSTIPGILAVALQLAGAFVFLAILDVRLAVAVVFIMPVALLVSKIYVKKTRAITREIRDEDGRIQTFLQESLGHRTLLSTLMGTERRADDYGVMQATLTSAIIRRTDISIYSNLMVTAGFMAGYAVTFLWSAYGLAAGVVSFGMMTAFLQLVAQVQRPVIDLSRRIPAFINASVALDRIDEILSMPLEDMSGVGIEPGTPGGLLFKGVAYHYPDEERRVISRLNHDFRPGSLTAIVGPTGSGKTTLLRLMLGLIAPAEGKAEFYTTWGESHPISAALRRNMVYVPQGNTLICGSVRDNLLLADPDATEEMMRRALRAAVADFVLDLPEGLDTLCREGGGGFSEGQAQRIAIARGLLKKGSIVLLDEPTSSLDPATERKLMTRLLAYMGHDRTIIIVTHRRGVLPYCTDVVELGN